MKSARIFVVIPVFNRKELTKNCLRSLHQQTVSADKIIVVDDGSTDGTSAMINTEFPGVVVLAGNGNLWWAGATNKGIEYTLQHVSSLDSDFILTLNNDLEVPDTYIERLLSNALQYRNALLGSVSVDIHNSSHMDFCGVRWNEYTGSYYSKAKDYHFSYSRLKEKTAVISSDLLPGRGTLIPIRAIKAIGLFDSVNFPQYAADEDFTLRARRKGWELILPTDVYLKSHIAQTGISTTRIQLRTAYFKELFFSLRSPLNLKIRYRFAVKNSKSTFFYFLIGLARITLSLSKTIVVQTVKKQKLVK